MADKKIRYSVELDTSEGEKKLEDLASTPHDSSETIMDHLSGESKSKSKTDREDIQDIGNIPEEFTEEVLNRMYTLGLTVSDITDNLGEITGNIVSTINESTNDIINAINGEGGRGGGKGGGRDVDGSNADGGMDDDPSTGRNQEVRESAEYVTDILALLRASTISGVTESFAAGRPGAAIGQIGAAIGGPIGVIVSAASNLVEMFVNLGEALQGYNAEIFGTMTQFQFAMDGLKIRLANGIAPAISNIVPKLTEFANAALPTVVFTVNKIADALSVVFVKLTILIPLIEAFIETLIAIPTALENTGIQLGEAAASVWSGTKNFARSAGNLGVDWEKTKDEFAEGIRKYKQGFWAATGYGVEELKDSVDAAEQRGEDAAETVVSVYENLQKFMENVDEMAEGFYNKVEEVIEDATEDADKLANEGKKLRLSLFLAAEEWAKGITGHGPQFNRSDIEDYTTPMPRYDGSLVPNTVPSIYPSHYPSTKDSVEDFIDHAGPSESIPLPTPAAINFKVTDQIKIQEADEQRIHEELLMLKDHLMRTIHGLQDASSVNLTMARNLMRQYF